MEVCVQGQWRMALDRERCDVVGPPTRAWVEGSTAGG